jgi:hypothetical protein
LKQSFNVGPLYLLYSQTIKIGDVLYRNFIIYSNPVLNKLVLAITDLDKDEHFSEVSVLLDSQMEASRILQGFIKYENNQKSLVYSIEISCALS